MSNVTHTTTIHSVCPHGGWDYYAVTFAPAEFLTCEAFQLACDRVRGSIEYQEQIASLLCDILPAGKLTVAGRHGANTETTCEAVK